MNKFQATVTAVSIYMDDNEMKQASEGFKKLSEYVAQTSNGRINIDPVTGNLGIGEPEQQSADETAKYVHEFECPRCGHCCKEWVGLTDDEVNEFAAGCHLGNSVQGAIYKAAARLKEKNIGGL
jgi:hypothetical protein